LFDSKTGDGSSPQGSLIQSGDNLYGLTSTGGVNGGGTIIAYNTATNTQSLLHSFGEQDNPPGSLTQSGSVLYGSTYVNLFAFDTNTSTYNILHSSFGPSGDLLVDGSILYGMTAFGGNYGYGIIFSYDTNTGIYTTLHSFDRTDGIGSSNGLLLEGSTLYGTTNSGGTNDNGVIFSLTIPEPTSISLVAASALLILRRRPVPRLSK
jgi:uncharacterized repeat protein (TIGR03803 family)